jgi:hypothetical protein
MVSVILQSMGKVTQTRTTLFAVSRPAVDGQSLLQRCPWKFLVSADEKLSPIHHARQFCLGPALRDSLNEPHRQLAGAWRHQPRAALASSFTRCFQCWAGRAVAGGDVWRRSGGEATLGPFQPLDPERTAQILTGCGFDQVVFLSAKRRRRRFWRVAGENLQGDGMSGHGAHPRGRTASMEDPRSRSGRRQSRRLSWTGLSMDLWAGVVDWAASGPIGQPGQRDKRAEERRNRA